MAALVDAAQRFFLQRGDAADLVARRGVAVPDFFAHQPQSGFVAMDDLENAVMHFRGGGAAGQNMLGTDKFRGLRENGGAACGYDAVAHLADDGVGGQTAGRIGAAALRADDQLGNGEFFFLEHGGFRHHFLGIADAHIHSLQRAADLLNDDLLDGLVGALLNGLDHQIHLAVFTAQRHHHSAVNIGVGGVARHYVHGQLLIGCHLRAALLVMERYRPYNLLRNNAGGIGSAETGRQNQYLVPNAYTAIGTLITVKSHAQFLLTLSPPDFPGVLPRCGRGRVHRP